MKIALILLLIAAAFLAVLAIVISSYGDIIGTAAQRRKRCEEILRSFDGRPEVKVRVTGTGMSPHETALLGSRYGYAASRWETRRGQPRYLIMHKVTASQPPAGYGPTPWYPPPAGSGYAPPANRPLSQAPDPRGRSRQIGALVALGIGLGAAAISNYRSGGAYVLGAVAAVVFLGAAAAVAWFTSPGRQRGTPPLPGGSPASGPQQAPPPPVDGPHGPPPDGRTGQ